jgi:hypothetical protein
MVPNSKHKQQALNALLRASLPSGSFEVVSVNGNGEAYVKTRSTDEVSAIHVAFQLIEAMNKLDIEFTQTDDTKFRVPLNSLGSV